MGWITRLRSIARRYVPPPLKPPLRQLAIAARRRYRDWRYALRRARAWTTERELYRAVQKGLEHPGFDPDLRVLFLRLLFDQPPTPARRKGQAFSEGGTPEVLYVTNRLSSDALKDIAALQGKGGMRCTVLCSAELENARVAQAWGVTLLTYTQPLELVELLQQVQAPVTIARRGSTVEATLTRLFSKGRFVYRPHDFVDRSPSGAPEIECRKLAIQRRTERFLLRTADGLIRIHDDSTIRSSRTDSPVRNPDVVVRPGSFEAFEAPADSPRLSDRDHQIHLVQLGISGRRPADPSAGIPTGPAEDSEDVLKQGLHLHVYNGNPLDTNRENGFREHVELASRYPKYHLEAVPAYPELSRELARYDFAYCYFPKRKNRQPDRSFGSLLTSFYSYIDAGLPVLTSPDNWLVADLVRQHHIGLVLQPGDLRRLNEILARIDPVQLRQNVQRARPHLRHESERLVDFVRRLGGLGEVVRPRIVPPTPVGVTPVAAGLEQSA